MRARYECDAEELVCMDGGMKGACLLSVFVEYGMKRVHYCDYPRFYTHHDEAGYSLRQHGLCKRSKTMTQGDEVSCMPQRRNRSSSPQGVGISSSFVGW